MKKKEATRFMKIIIMLCIATVIVFAAMAYLSAWFRIDTVPVLQIIAALFGGELLLTVVLKLLEKPGGSPKGDLQKREDRRDD